MFFRNYCNLAIDRRKLLTGSAAIAVSQLLPFPALAAAAAPYSFTQGEAEITVLSDGHLTVPLRVLAAEATEEELEAIVSRLGWTTETAQPATNIPLIRTGDDLILVDIGSGDKFQKTAGQLGANLARAGIDPASITKVVFTHAHPDHIFATLTGGGALMFPNAAYYVSAAEWDFWTAEDLLTRMPAEMADFVKGAQRDLAAVKERVTMVSAGSDIARGIRVLDTAGHTPGHISLELEGGEGLIITADSIASEVVSFEHPAWKFGFDADHESAIAQRNSLLDRAATDKTKMLGFHWSYPGVGFAERRDSAYTFVAAS